MPSSLGAGDTFITNTQAHVRMEWGTSTTSRFCAPTRSCNRIVHSSRAYKHTAQDPFRHPQPLSFVAIIRTSKCHSPISRTEGNQLTNAWP